MKRDYFIQFDYWDAKQTFSKFFYSIITFDLDELTLREACEQTISDNSELNLSDEEIKALTIKVNAFNLIETKQDSSTLNAEDMEKAVKIIQARKKFNDTRFSGSDRIKFEGETYSIQSVDFEHGLYGIVGRTIGSEDVEWLRCEDVEFISGGKA